MALYYNLKSNIVIPSTILYSLRIAFVIWGFLHFYMNFKIYFSVSEKKWICRLLSVTVVIFSVFNLPIHEHERSFHLLLSSSICFYKALSFSLLWSFTSKESLSNFSSKLLIYGIIIFTPKFPLISHSLFVFK
jgi:hypothetical protein